MFLNRLAAEPSLYLAPLLGCLLAGLSMAAQALPEDRDQPIRITADQALRDEKQGFTVYSGNVNMDQGTLHIDADRITVYHMEEEADRIVAEGSPAHLQQQPEPEKPLVHAEARVIEYFKAEDRVQLRQAAKIEQEGSIVTGDTIDYFITEQLVRADSDQADTGSRVEVVIPAQAIQEQDSDRGDTDSD
jgi:lipopolysaccharide export system protein LptA